MLMPKIKKQKIAGKTKCSARGGKKMKKENKKATKKFSRLEDVLFGFLIILALIFITQCLSGGQANVEKIQVAPLQPQRLSKMEKNIKKMVSDFPIKEMAPYIAKQDEEVAAFLLAIAKKESNWGMFSPKKNGRDCFNYWGYRGSYNQTQSGYSCFDSPKQAIKVVGGRIEELVASNVDTPQEMLLWKCGQRCNAKTSNGAAKWVRDVDLYYKKFYN
jgi:hypothetical protein